jgi:hypothetical protein
VECFEISFHYFLPLGSVRVLAKELPGTVQRERKVLDFQTGVSLVGGFPTGQHFLLHPTITQNIRK